MIEDAIAFFRDRFGITASDIERLLDAALSRGGDFADLYFEYRTLATVSFEETIVKNASRSITQGVGVRVIPGPGGPGRGRRSRILVVWPDVSLRMGVLITAVESVDNCPSASTRAVAAC